jgi:hypothetical protein
MGTETFNADNLMQAIKDRIKGTLVGLIPEEHWDNLIDNEVQAFFKPKVQNTYSNNRVEMSDFQAIVNRELEALCRTKIHEFLTGPKFQSRWDPISNENVLSEDLMNNIVARSPEIFARIMGNGVRDIVQNMSYSLPR